MALVEQKKFISLVEEYFLRKQKPNLKILEIGSYIVNQSIRDYFQDCEYLGVDLVAGPGVDLVCPGQELDFPDASFDVAISSEVFEHNPYWVETFRNMHRMTKPGGLIVLTCASRGRFEHGTRRSGIEDSPGTAHVGIDHYRNLNASDFKKEFKLADMFSQHFFYYLPTHKDLYFCGWKTGASRFSGDMQAFIGEVKKIRRLSQYKSVPFFYGLMSKCYRFTIVVASYILSDRSFQNFQIRYLAFLKPLKTLLAPRVANKGKR